MPPLYISVYVLFSVLHIITHTITVSVFVLFCFQTGSQLKCYRAEDMCRPHSLLHFIGVLHDPINCLVV